jgi:glutamine cyclotransferase
VLVLALLLAAACESDERAVEPLAASPPATSPVPPAPTVRGRVVNVYPHDRTAFTQGLIFHDGFLFESTGQNGRSTVRRVDLVSGEVLQQRSLDVRYFGEGLTELGGRLAQLTWQARAGFFYDPATLAVEETFSYSGEGWGLTDDGRRFIMSDGSDALRFFSAQTFAETGRLRVRDGSTPVVQLNELEFVRGEIYANVWHLDRIARIDPESGRVLGWIDLSDLLAPGEVRDPEAVLNGIAYDEEGDRLFVTGKNWPKLFEIAVD